MKKYANSALIYAILAMVGGVFFREFTKFNGSEGATTLAFVHTHYFALGMIVFLLLVLLENALHITDAKVSRAVIHFPHFFKFDVNRLPMHLDNIYPVRHGSLIPIY